MTQAIAEDLANRLRKNLRKLKPFIKRGHTDAYRIYDADIPEYAIAVDRYGDCLHVQEYAPPRNIEPEIAEQRLLLAVATLPGVLGVAADNIVLKQRRQQKGTEQYERQAHSRHELVVTEHGVRLKVNLRDYLDTGLFLDHRPIRFWLQQQAKGKRVLNLFCYTATASAHAALGGAVQVDSVDMSATYLAWGEDNFRLNGLDPAAAAYRFIQADVMQWLDACKTDGFYDLIFLDPPTFSNSKRMRDVFDVQRDHPFLIQHAMRLLKPGGVLMFSNNFRKFKLDQLLVAQYVLEDYHQKSLPEDFKRNPKIHGCWLVRHR